jgi:hypothetical protein
MVRYLKVYEASGSISLLNGVQQSWEFRGLRYRCPAARRCGGCPGRATRTVRVQSTQLPASGWMSYATMPEPAAAITGPVAEDQPSGDDPAQ